MNNDKELRILPNKGIIAILIGCIILSIFLLFNRPLRRIPREAAPEVLLSFSIWILLLEWHTVVLKNHTLFVQHHPIFLNRKISVDNVENIEYIHRKNQWLLITLKGCPALADSKCKEVSLYIALHPVKVIAARCSEEEGRLWMAAIRNSSTGDGLREP